MLARVTNARQQGNAGTRYKRAPARWHALQTRASKGVANARQQGLNYKRAPALNSLQTRASFEHSTISLSLLFAKALKL